MIQSVLLVEDSRSQALRIKYELQRQGFQVMVAHTGKQGLAMTNRRRPDVIILDIELPDLNGFEICRHLKRHPDTNTIPVILLTSQSSSDATVTGLNAGAVDFIPKDRYAEMRLLELLDDLALQGR